MTNTERLLTLLGRGGTWQYYWGGRQINPIWFPAGTNPNPPHWEAVYFGVHPSTRRLSGKSRGGVDNIAAINCLYAEFDRKDGWTLGKIMQLTPAPSVIISSGGGWHCYWLFVDPVLLFIKDLDQVKDLQARWVLHQGGDPGAKDLARVLRVPGTMNNKYDPPRPVQFIKADFDLLYSLEYLANFLPPPPPKPEYNGSTTPADIDPADVGDYWLKKALERARPGIRNQVGFDLACQLRDSGLSRSAALQILSTYQQRVTNSTAPYTPSEAKQTVLATYQLPAREPANIKVDR